ncbi:NADH-quinone oxidoreductase subunit L [Thermodesulfobacterium sp. TA1]|uniref:NADH-quinone oxidoreductase subunit 5 family protein n=1 Tax=Thermodesulfobacterium sp. TA1 TaxID=2234087 RepID=UPI001232D0CC|nr:NADH-quinone oxidoreductase subunit L [Thermodesulfobacterium sp. TA1]QER42760.1 NADH-quinone oxidoreductase subunit L [Thermodesulfobacterium sp. TA1]
MFLAFSVLVLFFGALISGLFYRINSARFHGSIAFITSVGSLIFLTLVFFEFIQFGESFWRFSLFPWAKNFINLDLVFKANGLNLFFALFGAYVSVGINLYAIKYMTHEKEGFGRFYTFIQLFIGSYLGLVLSENLFWSYIFFELTGVCSYQLIAFWYRSELSSFSAKKAFLITHIAGYGFLLGLLLFYLSPDPKVYQDLILAGLLVAVLAKSVQWPLYTWIPYAMNAPTPVSALLHAACLVKCGVYLLFKFYFLFGGFTYFWQNLLIYLGMFSSLIGVLFALKQADVKKLLAYHTVSQIGYMVSGIGLGTSLGLAASLFHTLNHALFKGLLFLVAGVLQQATHTRDLSKMGGLASKLPKTTFLYLIGAASISGIPGFNGFVSKWMFYQAAIEANHPLAAALGLIISTLTTLSFIKVLDTAFLGNPKTEVSTLNEKPFKLMITGGALLGIPCVIFGIFPQIAIDFLINPVLSLLSLTHVGFSWYQLPTPLIGLLVFFSLGLGGLVYLAWIKPQGIVKETEVFKGGEDEKVFNPTADDFVADIETRLASFYQKADPDQYIVKFFNWIERLITKVYETINKVEKFWGRV